MKVQEISCPSCFANLTIREGQSVAKCEYCGSSSSVTHEQGETTLNLMDQVVDKIDSSSTATQQAIQNSSHVTQAELKRMSITQDISLLQMQLTSLQSEIRGLEREKSTKIIKKQLKELKVQETDLKTRIKTMQDSLLEKTSQASGGASSNQEESLVKQFFESPGCLPGCLSWFIVSAILLSIVEGSERAENVATAVGLAIGIAVYAYFRNKANDKSTDDTPSN